MPPAKSTIADPANKAIAIAPSDTAEIPFPSSALWVGQQGRLRVTMVNGFECVFENAVGWMPLRVEKVWEDGTDAADIVAVSNEA